MCWKEQGKQTSVRKDWTQKNTFIHLMPNGFPVFIQLWICSVLVINKSTKYIVHNESVKFNVKLHGSLFQMSILIAYRFIKLHSLWVLLIVNFAVQCFYKQDFCNKIYL